MASEQRRRDQQRIRDFTRRLAYGAVAATAVFGGFAAVESQHTATSNVQSTQVDDSSSGDSSSSSTPTQSFQPPVAQSGGS